MSPSQALKVLKNRDLPSSVASLCGPEAVVRLSLARADLYTALSSTHTSLSSSHILTSRTAHPPSHTPTTTTHLTPPTPSHHQSASPPSSSSSTRPEPGPSRSTSQVHLHSQPHLVKTLLVEQAERTLREASHSLLPSLGPSPLALELRVKMLISLSRLSLSLHHCSTATKLSLAALRCLQRDDSSPLFSGSVTNRLWLQCRLLLAQSLVGRRVNCVDSGAVMECGVQCVEGVREAERFNDPEHSAEFHFTASLHALSNSPPDGRAIATHTQQCLHLLASLPSPSPSSSLLHARCVLLLCEVGCRDGHVTSHDATQVYQRLMNKLKKQVQSSLRMRNI